MMNPAGAWVLVKIAFLIVFFLYAIFAGVIVRQVYLMTETLEVGFENQIRTIIWIHFFLSIAVFAFTLLFL